MICRLFVFLSICRLLVTHVLWLNGKSIIALDRAGSYAVGSNHVSICSGLAAILNEKLLPAATTHVR